MYKFVIIAIISYLIGSIPATTEDYRKYGIEFAKGAFALMMAGVYLHSGLSYLMAAIGVLAGQSRPIFLKLDGQTTEIVSLGIISYISWVFGLILVASFITMKAILKDYRQSIFATAIIIPFVAFRIFKSDSFIIISLIIFVSLILQFWPQFLEDKLQAKMIYNLLVGLGVLSFIAVFFFNKYVYKGFGLQKDIIRHGPRNLNYAALTFDDGPDPIYTPEILDILKAKDVKATFFLIGKNVVDYPEVAKRIVEEGHNIGSHTYSHRSLIPLTSKATNYEIKIAEKAIEEFTGVRPTLFRPPRGVYSSYARKLLKEERYTMALWDISAVDWAELSPHEIVANVVNKVQPGSIILMHDSGDLIKYRGGNRTSTVKALPEIIDKLRAQGYEFVTVDQMILLSELMETEDTSNESYISPAPAY